ncbi:DNA-protecting protein DprA [Microbacterium protaetiae]|uniref:DNA-protecting protein DprA n=1 Tax=Microbacterium protaetiae TaxID=2509458 RepID=A0A4P6EIR0_9MICO|nr:DNA-processing protein DprA [Microbacterium protaetiae]QAY61159.1 DNA-protecting protein DprA [Microbacterium protaetiae]
MTAYRWSDDAIRTAAPLTPSHAGDPDLLSRAYAAAVWSCLVEPGDGIAGAFVGALGPDVALRELLSGVRGSAAADAAGLTTAQLREAVSRWRPRLDADAIAFAIRQAATLGVRLMTPDDEGWPAALYDLGPHAPLCLWVRGDPSHLSRLDPAVAIVGARAATGYGEHIAAEFAAELAGRGIAVVSGAAYGIDGAAHRGALAAGGLTVALVAGGLDRPYPAGHTDLLRRIAAAGCVVSEVPCGTVPSKWRFLQRNRLIAALGGATIVVEAGIRSGSLNTASHAADLGRPLGAVPGSVTSGSSAGCHRILREFDSRCVTTADEVCELLGMTTQLTTASFDDRTDDRTRVVDALSSRSWRAVDDVARRSGMAPADVRSQLGLLALEGGAESRGASWRRVASRGER